MAYSTCVMVAALIPNLLDGASNLDNLGEKIRPASSQIRQFMSSGCSLIDAKISSMGYAAAGSGGTLGDFLAAIEANYSAWQSETARSSPRTNKGERGRASTFKRAYESGLKQLAEMDLGVIGFTKATSDGGWYVGGISQSEKDAVASDTDRVEPAFTRGEFDNPGTDIKDEQA